MHTVFVEAQSKQLCMEFPQRSFLYFVQEVHAWAALPAHKSLVRYYTSWQEADPGGNGDHIFIQLERCGATLTDIGRLARKERSAASQDSMSDKPQDGRSYQGQDDNSSQRQDPMLCEATLITVLGCVRPSMLVFWPWLGKESCVPYAWHVWAVLALYVPNVLITVIT